MDPANLIVSYLFFSFFGGLLATAAFSGLLYFFERTHVTQGNMIIALAGELAGAQQQPFGRCSAQSGGQATGSGSGPLDSTVSGRRRSG